MRTSQSRILLPLLLSIGTMLGIIQAQDPVIDELIDPLSLSADGTTLTVVFEDLRQDPDTSNFEAQHSDNMTRWTGISGGTVVRDGNTHRYTLTANDPGGPRKFYRIIRYSTTAEDSDGDGLSDNFEVDVARPAGERTDPAKADSDDDGFDDGTEFSLGTNPNSASSFPDQATLPEVDFVSPIASVREGEGTLSIELEITPKFVGTIYYSISPRSSATEGDDFSPLPEDAGTGLKTVMTNAAGTAATISLNVIDDLEISPERLLLLDLSTNPPGNGYRASGSVTQIVCLSDNDAYWSGVFKDPIAERNFRLCIKQNATTKEMVFVSGGADGLPKPDGGASSQSTGVIPVGVADNGDPITEWPADSAAFTLTPPNFFAAVSDLPASTAGFTAPLKRTFRLFAEPDAYPNELVKHNQIVGFYVESIEHATDDSITYLNRSMSGSFSLARDLPNALEINSPFDPTND